MDDGRSGPEENEAPEPTSSGERCVDRDVRVVPHLTIMFDDAAGVEDAGSSNPGQRADVAMMANKSSGPDKTSFHLRFNIFLFIYSTTNG